MNGNKSNNSLLAQRDHEGANTQRGQARHCKSVEFSYPTSPNAKRFGFYATGCYTVEVTKDQNPPIAYCGFATRREALQYAKAIDLPWSYCFERFNLEDAREWR